MRRKQQPTKPQREAPDDFCDWWNPSGTHQPSGANTGGHPDARRVWARKDVGRWTHRIYGVNAASAWLVKQYQDEYDAWVQADRPARSDGPFVSIAATPVQQQEFLRKIAGQVSQIGKPVPNPRAEERAQQQKIQQQKVDMHTKPNKGDNNTNEQAIEF